MNKSLTKVLNNLLLMRLKADCAPCSSDQHWCDAITELVKLIPDYKTDNPEFISELEYIETNQKLLNLKLCLDQKEQSSQTPYCG